MLYEFPINHENYDKVVVDSEKCLHCKYCKDSCTEDVLALDRKLGIVIVANPDNCNSCNLCACPYGARYFLPENAEVADEAFALIGSQIYNR